MRYKLDATKHQQFKNLILKQYFVTTYIATLLIGFINDENWMELKRNAQVSYTLYQLFYNIKFLQNYQQFFKVYKNCI